MYIAETVIVPQCFYRCLSFLLLLALSLGSLTDYRVSQCHFMKHTKHFATHVSVREKNWSYIIVGVSYRCMKNPREFSLLRGDVMFFARHGIQDRKRPIDESNAHSSRPRDRLTVVPAAQRHRDPWRHYKLNHRLLIRLESFVVCITPRDLAVLPFFFNFNPMLMVFTYNVMCLHYFQYRTYK